MKNIILIGLLLFSQLGIAQKVISTSSSIKFFSSATLEDITATTTKGKSAIDLSNGKVGFSIPINSFEFAKSLMQEHFNEKYMETEKFPKATFSGVIQQWESGKSKNEVIALGALTIHGVTKEVTVKGSVKYEKMKLVVTAKFNVKLEDYDVEVPSLLFQKIAEVVEVTVTFEYPIDEK